MAASFRRGIRIQYSPYITQYGVSQRYGTFVRFDKRPICIVRWDDNKPDTILNICTIEPTDDFQIIAWLYAMERAELHRLLTKYPAKLPSGHPDRTICRVFQCWEYLHQSTQFPSHIKMLDLIPNSGESTRNRIIEMYANQK
jgi:hypothetical protein